MTATDKAAAFAALHQQGAPLGLYHAWDAGSARAIAKSAATAIGTSSWAVAAAQGFDDGEVMPLDQVVQITARIAATTDLPVTADIEGGYAEHPEQAAQNFAKFLQVGVVGVNFEDRRILGTGLYGLVEQSNRIAALRAVAKTLGVAAFINARTDVFFGGSGDTPHAELLNHAVERGAAYAEAGANGFFAPGLLDPDLIGALCERIPLPVNIMMAEGAPSIQTLAGLGVRRVSYGPQPYVAMLSTLRSEAARSSGR